MYNQKNEFDKINVGSVWNSLNESISEARTPYMNYIKNLFYKKPQAAPPTVSSVISVAPVNEEEYIKRLDDILSDAQSQLNRFLADLDLRVIRRNMAMINFIFTPSKKKKKLNTTSPIKITEPEPDLSKKIPAPGKPPINPIFEGDLRAWKSRTKQLEELMKTLSHNVEIYLQNMAKSVGYMPTKNDLDGLIREFGKFPNLTPKTKRRIKVRLQTFVIAYSQLISWLNLFKRTEKGIEKGQNKYTSI